jgi:hypothetical protein
MNAAADPKTVATAFSCGRLTTCGSSTAKSRTLGTAISISGFVGANSNHMVNNVAIWDFFSRFSR